MSKFLVPFFLGLVSLNSAMAAPKVYPEVIPGPGLPSLASLNLTSAQLYEMESPEVTLARAGGLTMRAAAYTGRCGPADAAYTNVNDIIACYNYLRSLGTRKCVTTNGINGNQMCVSGQAQIVGESLVNSQTTASYCSDVAVGVLWVINSCTRPDQSCAGSQAANGNGDLVAVAVNINW